MVAKLLSNADLLCGLPTLAVRRVFETEDRFIGTIDIEKCLHLTTSRATEVFSELVSLGYIAQRPGHETWSMGAATELARSLVAAPIPPPMNRPLARRLVAQIMEEIELVNVSPAYACNVTSIRIFGDLLFGSIKELPFLEAEVTIKPKEGKASAQRDAESVAAAFRDGQDGQRQADDSYRAIQVALLAVHPQWCLRFSNG
ncbi:hypothetical protein [Lacisediminimonas profundi]|uniref:hypothetical protein n=1 Tax=Lacisediminimonas profundi TaxID=2603856 RepID=UPI00124AF27D|nr:hypothetical protein [Lacisediminimonas profundi]